MTDDTTRQTGQPAPAEQAAPAASTAAAPATAGAPSAAATTGDGPAMSNGAAPAGTARVLPAGAGGGASRARWAIALGVAGLAVAAIVAAVVVFGSRPTPPALTYIPANAVMVFEVRPDLPGDQLQKLGNLLAHFPGFADQSTLPEKLDESFGQLLGRATDGGVDYATDVKPWLSGPAFLALLPPGDAANADNPTSFMHGVASLTTTGTVACGALFEGETTTTETYQSLQLTLGPGGSAACALDGPQALLGDPASVRAAIDTHAAGNGLDKDAEYQAARGSLQGDQLGAMYLSGTDYLAMLDRLSELAPTVPGMQEMPDLSMFPGTFPAWVVQGVRAEDDAVVLDVVAEAGEASEAPGGPRASLLPMPAAHASAILPFAPANTVVFLESQGTGVSVLNAITQLRQLPELAPALEMLEGSGDPAEMVGWIEDVGLIVANADSGVSGGIVVVARDATAATERAAGLKTLIGLAGMGGAAVDSRDSTVAGVNVTTFTISDLGSLVPPGQVPPGVVPEDGSIEFSIATRDKVILIGAGSGEAFMTAALTAEGGSGLDDQAFYKAATSRAISPSQVNLYVGIRDIVAILEPLIPAEERAQWETEIKPYVGPFQALSMSSSMDAAGSGRSRITLTVTNP